MSFEVRIARRAEAQIRKAAHWWATNRHAAPAMFRDDLRAALDFIEEFPHAGEQVRHRRIQNLRRVLLSRVQYHLYYEVVSEAKIIKVIAVWHASRGTRPPL